MDSKVLAAFVVFATLPMLVTILAGGKSALRPLLAGVLSIVGSFLIERALEAMISVDQIALTGTMRAFFEFGFLEELIKLSTLDAFSLLYVQKTNVIKAGVICGMSFGSLENAIYAIGFGIEPAMQANSFSLNLSRFFMPLLMHTSLGAVLVSGYVLKGFKPIGGFVLAWVLHSLYDVAALSANPRGLRYAYIVLIVGVLSAAMVFRTAATQERE